MNMEDFLDSVALYQSFTNLLRNVGKTVKEAQTNDELEEEKLLMQQQEEEQAEGEMKEVTNINNDVNVEMLPGKQKSNMNISGQADKDRVEEQEPPKDIKISSEQNKHRFGYDNMFELF